MRRSLLQFAQALHKAHPTLHWQVEDPHEGVELCSFTDSQHPIKGFRVCLSRESLHVEFRRRIFAWEEGGWMPAHTEYLDLMFHPWSAAGWYLNDDIAIQTLRHNLTLHRCPQPEISFCERLQRFINRTPAFCGRHHNCPRRGDMPATLFRGRPLIEDEKQSQRR